MRLEPAMGGDMLPDIRPPIAFEEPLGGVDGQAEVFVGPDGGR